MKPSDIPVEVLQRIFTHSLPKDPLSYPQPNIRVSPIVLCHVCSHWRKVALNTATLWTRLYQIHRSWVHGLLLDDKQLAMYFWWRNNAGDVPMSLRFDVLHKTPVDVSRGLDGNDALLEEFLQSLSNAGHLDLSMAYLSSLNLSIGHHLELTDPKTESMVIRAHGLDEIEIWKGLDLLPLPREYPLHRLHIEGISVSNEAEYLHPTWGTLTHVMLRLLGNTTDWSKLIKQLVNLRVGKFEVEGNLAHNGTCDSSKVELSQLIHLDVQWRASDIDSVVFESLRLPNLRALRLTSNLNIGKVNKILQSTPGLHELQLYSAIPIDFETGVETGITLQEQVPFLKTLVLDVNTKINRNLYVGPSGYLHFLFESRWIQASDPNGVEDIILAITVDSHFMQRIPKLMAEIAKRNKASTWTKLSATTKSPWAIERRSMSGYFDDLWFREIIL